MKRLIIVCEGPTERFFCEKNLLIHLQDKNVFIQTPLIKASRGGIVKWPVLKTQIETHLKSEPSAVVTTFIDYYGLYQKHSFPNWNESEKIPDRNKRMEALEAAMYEDIHSELRYRFIPYLQLHEFEGLLFTDIDVIYDQIPPEDIIGKEELERTFTEFENPEMINNQKETSPSHRLERIINGYSKIVHGDILAEAIGLERIKDKSPRFNKWVTKLETLDE